MSDLNGSSWEECRRYVLAELNRLNATAHAAHQTATELRVDIGAMETSIAVLKIKYAIYGALLGSLPSLLIVVLLRFI